jgi:hypothetical protein
MSEKQYTIDDMINAARAESPSDFQSAFASIVLDKIADSIEAKKIEVAKNYFNYEDADAEASEEQEEEPNEDTEAAAGTEEA